MVALTYPCTKPQHLVPGAYYLLKGTFLGKPLPVQVFHLHYRTATQALGTIYYNAFGQRAQPSCLYLADVNIPEHGNTDLHLERIPEATVRQVLGDEVWADIAQDLQRDVLQPHGLLLPKDDGE